MRSTFFLLCAAIAIFAYVDEAAGKPRRITIDELDVKLTGGARGPNDIQRNLRQIKGSTYVVAGTVLETSPDNNSAIIKGDGQTTINCEFESMPNNLKIGNRITVKGILSGYFFGSIFEHCTIYEETTADKTVAPSNPAHRRLASRPAPNPQPPQPAPLEAPQPSQTETPQGRMVCTPRRTGGEACHYVPSPEEAKKPPGN